MLLSHVVAAAPTIVAARDRRMQNFLGTVRQVGSLEYVALNELMKMKREGKQEDSEVQQRWVAKIDWSGEEMEKAWMD